MPNAQLLDSLPILLVFVAFAVIAMLFYEAGFRLGRWWQDRTPGEQEGPTGMLVGSILALLAFLLAVTMGMAADRFDARRAIVLDEANAIGTAYLRAGYLPTAGLRPGTGAAPRVRPAPHRRHPAGQHRCRHREVGEDPGRPVGDHRGSGAQQRVGRRRALRRIGQRRDRPAREPRITAGSARVPETILLLLVGGAALSLGMVGYSAGLTGRRSLLSAVVLIIALGAVIMIVVDLDRPREGFIQVSQQPLIDLQQQIGPPTS